MEQQQQQEQQQAAAQQPRAPVTLVMASPPASRPSANVKRVVP
jgi:hypothetical protein